MRREQLSNKNPRDRTQAEGEGKCKDQKEHLRINKWSEEHLCIRKWSEASDNDGFDLNIDDNDNDNYKG